MKICNEKCKYFINGGIVNRKDARDTGCRVYTIKSMYVERKCSKHGKRVEKGQECIDEQII